MGYRVFVTGSGIADAAQRLLRAKDCSFQIGDPKDGPDDIERKLRRFDPDGLIVRQGKITAAVQAAPKRLRVICKHGVGTDDIDIEEATRRRIPVMITPGANTESVAEHALALMLALTRRVPMEDRRIRAGSYDKSAFDGVELAGKTLGVIGFGRTARRLSELVGSLRMSVVAYHPSHTPEALPPHISKVGCLEDLLSRADVVSLHCPLLPETRGLIDGRTLARTKPGVFIVNTARGGLIVEGHLAEALREGRVSGAGLDVLESEPLADDSPLRALDNVVLTPHVAGSSDQSLANMGLAAVRNVLAVLDGVPVDRRSILNGEVLGE